MMITQSEAGGIIKKEINYCQPQTTFHDYTGNVSGTVTTDNNGVGEFKVKASAAKGWSVWVPNH